MHNLIRLAQYSLLHHSSKRRRVSRPTNPPSASNSLLFDEVDGAGDDPRLGIGDWLTGLSRIGLWFFLSTLAAFVKLSLFPLPNLDQTWPGLLKCLLT